MDTLDPKFHHTFSFFLSASEGFRKATQDQHPLPEKDSACTKEPLWTINLSEKQLGFSSERGEFCFDYKDKEYLKTSYEKQDPKSCFLTVSKEEMKKIFFANRFCTSPTSESWFPPHVSTLKGTFRALVAPFPALEAKNTTTTIHFYVMTVLDRVILLVARIARLVYRLLTFYKPPGDIAPRNNLDLDISRALNPDNHPLVQLINNRLEQNSNDSSLQKASRFIKENSIFVATFRIDTLFLETRGSYNESSMTYSIRRIYSLPHHVDCTSREGLQVFQPPS